MSSIHASLQIICDNLPVFEQVVVCCRSRHVRAPGNQPDGAQNVLVSGVATERRPFRACRLPHRRRRAPTPRSHVCSPSHPAVPPIWNADRTRHSCRDTIVDTCHKLEPTSPIVLRFPLCLSPTLETIWNMSLTATMSLASSASASHSSSPQWERECGHSRNSLSFPTQFASSEGQHHPRLP